MSPQAIPSSLPASWRTRATLHSGAHLHLADTYYQSGQTEPAIVAYNEVLRLDPKSAAAYNGLALCLLRKGDIDGAIAHFRTTLIFLTSYLLRPRTSSPCLATTPGEKCGLAC